MQLTKLVVGLSLALGFVATAAAQTTMRISISTAQNSHQGVAIDTFAKEVEKRTAGRYKVQTFYNGSLGGERESIEAVQLGTQELAFSSSGPVPNFVPETKILDVPFLFRDKAHARAVLDGPIGQELLTKFESKGFKALAWGENGVRHMTNSKRAVNEPGDLKGLKMRTMENPVHVAAYKGLGIVTTPMAFPEVFTALQQGTVDGQENPLFLFTLLKMQTVGQKYITTWGYMADPLVFVVNKEIWNSWTPADQAIVRQAAVDAGHQEIAIARKGLIEADKPVIKGIEALGVTVTQLTPAQREAFVTATRGVYNKWKATIGADLVNTAEAAIAARKK